MVGANLGFRRLEWLKVQSKLVNKSGRNLWDFRTIIDGVRRRIHI